MSAEEEVAKGKADETQAIAAEAQKDLDEALPALDAAQKVRERTNARKRLCDDTVQSLWLLACFFVLRSV